MRSTSIFDLHDGDERVAVLHFPEDLLLVDDHLANFGDLLIDGS